MRSNISALRVDKFGGAAALLFILLATGCARPKTADLPIETELPPSQAPLWSALAAARTDDWFYLLNTGMEGLEWRLKMIDSATTSIDLETFLWQPDSSGMQIQAHILAAADRGVRVRFLLDDSFTMHEDLALHGLDDHPNIDLRIYNPLRHRSNSAFWRELFNIGEFSRINHRMHNKLLIIDGRAALVGGRNLADEYFGFDASMNFRDMEVITTGVSVAGTIRHFDAFWNSGWALPLGDVIPEPADADSLNELRERLVTSAPVPANPDPELLDEAWLSIESRGFAGSADFYFDEPAVEDPAAPDYAPDQLAGELQRLIENANQEVIIISAYLVPTDNLHDAIKSAEQRGAEVRILTNSLKSNNHLAAHAAYRGHVEKLIDNGVDLYEVRVKATDRNLYMQSPVDKKELGLHAKLLLIDDDIAFIGSCNLDPRSLKINTEVGLIIRSFELNQALRQDLNIDFDPSNAWKVERDNKGKVVWIGAEGVFPGPPDASQIERLEDWFIGLLPIDQEM